MPCKRVVLPERENPPISIRQILYPSIRSLSYLLTIIEESLFNDDKSSRTNFLFLELYYEPLEGAEDPGTRGLFYSQQCGQPVHRVYHPQ